MYETPPQKDIEKAMQMEKYNPNNTLHMEKEVDPDADKVNETIPQDSPEESELLVFDHSQDNIMNQKTSEVHLTQTQEGAKDSDNITEDTIKNPNTPHETPDPEHKGDENETESNEITTPEKKKAPDVFEESTQGGDTPPEMEDTDTHTEYQPPEEL